jgi:HSF-type DNA-binding
LFFSLIIIHEEVPVSALIFCVRSCNCFLYFQNGVSFTIRDQARFARELLPLYYKHNNMASFVRQLNMYGFHKVVSVDSGGLKLDKDEMEFAHPYFLRGHEYLLDHIKRKIPISKQEETKTKPELMTRVCDFLFLGT